MALQMLKPLTEHEVALLKANQYVADETVDWLQDRETPAADVALMFGQGIPEVTAFKVPADSPYWRASDEQRLEWERYAQQFLTDFWHLPQATFALWSGCVFGANRRRAVETWVDDFLITDPAAADREHRRCILRLFPEVTRRLSSTNLDDLRPDLARAGLGNDRPRIFHQGNVFHQTLRAEDFVPPEPVEPHPQSPYWNATEEQRRDWERLAPLLRDPRRGRIG